MQSTKHTKTRRPVRYRFDPVGLDKFDPRASTPPTGAIVVKTQPFGCPKNGTMGFCYVADAKTGVFYGLVCLNSLQPVCKRK